MTEGKKQKELTQEEQRLEYRNATLDEAICFIRAKEKGIPMVGSKLYLNGMECAALLLERLQDGLD